MPDDPARDIYAETTRRLEPDISGIDHTLGAASSAISLRRIADELAETNAHLKRLIVTLECIEMNTRG